MALILIKRLDNGDPPSNKKWWPGDAVDAWETGHQFAPGSAEHLDSGRFLHLTVTDRTRAEALEWLTRWTHGDATVTQLSAQGNNRVIRVEVFAVSVSGEGGLDNAGSPIAGFSAMLDEINELHPQANASYNAHTNTTYDFDIKAPAAARDQVMALAFDVIRNTKIYQRRWNMPQSSRDLMIANGGAWSATAQQIIQGGHLVDRLSL